MSNKSHQLFYTVLLITVKTLESTSASIYGGSTFVMVIVDRGVLAREREREGEQEGEREREGEGEGEGERNTQRERERHRETDTQRDTPNT